MEILLGRPLHGGATPIPLEMGAASYPLRRAASIIHSDGMRMTLEALIVYLLRSHHRNNPFPGPRYQEPADGQRCLGPAAGQRFLEPVDTTAPAVDDDSDDDVTPPRVRKLAALARRRRHGASVERQEAPVGATLKIHVEKVDPSSRCDYDPVVVRIGDVAVETTFSDEDNNTRPWLKKVAVLTRGRRLRAPLVVGLVALRGRARSTVCNRGGPCLRASSTVRGVALCVGGSHVLVYQPNAAWDPPLGATGRIGFHRNKMSSLGLFLGNASITVACLGADEAANSLAMVWGLHVARPVDLMGLVERAYGEHVAVNVMVGGRRQMSTVKVKDLDIEGLALLVLGREISLQKVPAMVAQANWGRIVGIDEVKFAARDAYLSFEIAARCFEKLAVSTSA
ncbi:hypothetical protein ACP70R_041058 [Stipagrostis hirtigluma subsp. patula]